MIFQESRTLCFHHPCCMSICVSVFTLVCHTFDRFLLRRQIPVRCQERIFFSVLKATSRIVFTSIIIVNQVYPKLWNPGVNIGIMYKIYI